MIALSWSMVAILIAVTLLVALGLLLALTWVVRDALRLHLFKVDERLDRIVTLVDAANLQYHVVKKEIALVDKTAREALAKAKDLESDVKLIQRRFGILSGAAAIDSGGGQR